MDNPRAEKVAVVTEVREHFERANAAILTEYRGLTVKDLAGLRRTLRDAGGEYKIYKNTLVRFAAHDLGLDGLDSLLTGPTAIAFVDGDAAAVAKALREYARTNPKLTVKGGVLGSRVMSVADASALADLPPREVVLARLAGALAAPMQAFAGLLQAVPRSFAYGLKALIEKRGGVPDGSAADAEATDASAPVDEQTPTSSAAPAAPPAAAVVHEPEPAPVPPPAVEPAADPEPAAAVPAASEVTESVAEAVSEPPLPAPSADDAEPAAALVADTEPAAAEPAATEAAREAVEPPALEDAAEAAQTPALVDEPIEVEPLAAHGIPANVQPEILSVEPEPEPEPERDTPPAH